MLKLISAFLDQKLSDVLPKIKNIMTENKIKYIN